jgi:hypothetical protein
LFAGGRSDDDQSGSDDLARRHVTDSETLCPNSLFLFPSRDGAAAVAFASSGIRRPEDDDSRRSFRVVVCLVDAAASSASPNFTAAAASAIGEICSSLADAFLSCGARPHAQLHVVNMALELAHALSLRRNVASALAPSVAASLRDTFVSALTMPSE